MNIHLLPAVHRIPHAESRVNILVTIKETNHFFHGKRIADILKQRDTAHFFEGLNASIRTTISCAPGYL
ncbi:MAG TPA: hypothetical protein DEB39_07665 [Planctomycetaceae bacterium]|nr:hypothetical protein [Planctomycetaceae bacterium]